MWDPMLNKPFHITLHEYLDHYTAKRAVLIIMFFILVFERMLTDSIQVTNTCSSILYYTIIMTSLVNNITHKINKL